jgi:2-polyprenyl-3-methyl-5-hydroxy-6-metoxy-1,4-benzoquinol methylase
MPDFSQRSEAPEIMDDLQCSGEVVRQTLRELDTINSLLGGNYVTILGLEKLLAHEDQKKSISVVDVGCGSGDMLRRIRKWAVRKGLSLDLVGIDANPSIIQYAVEHTSSYENIDYRVANIFSEDYRRMKFDIIIATLFLHHFTESQLIDFFRNTKSQVKKGLIVNDIHRNWFAFYSIKFLTKLFSRSSMVKFDAPLSVLRAFRKKDLIRILDKAGIENYTIRWMWAFRWQLIINT